MWEEWEESIDDRIGVPKPIATAGELVYITLVPGVFLFKFANGYYIFKKGDETHIIIGDYTIQSSFSAIYAGNRFPNMSYDNEVIKLFVEDLSTKCNKVELPKKWIIEYVCRSERVTLTENII